MSIPAFLRIGQFLLLLTIVIVASLYPIPPGTLRGGLDKVMHFLTYFILFISLDFALGRGKWYLRKLIFLLFVSWLIEIAQHYLPPRHYSLLDLLANLGGLILGLGLLVLLNKIRSTASGAPYSAV